jgi:dihydrolipoamide dehydrogenase
MVVGEVSERADVVVIGAGPGGYVAALRCADLLDVSNSGARVVLVERDAIGGVCLNVGCIPSKVLIHSAEVADLARRSASWGVHLQASVDIERIHEHRRATVEQLTGGVATLLDHAGVERWEGSARFSKPDRLAIVSGAEVRHLEFANAIIATGSRPTPLGTLPIDGERIVDSTGALDFTTVPRQLVVVGGGYIGIELGTAWSKLGSSVTIVEGTDRILPAMDPSLSREVARRLDQLGVTVHVNQMIESPDDPLLVGADRVVVAVGRTPNTDDLGLDIAGVPVNQQGHIVVGPDRRATANIFAIGDVTTGPALAHKATAEAEAAASAIAGHRSAFDPMAIPEVVFSDPEIATVGHTESSARAAGIEPTVFRFPFAAGSRSRTIGDHVGFVQLVADQDETVIGGQLAGAGVAELAGEIALAIELSATAYDVAATIHPHPTMSEGIAEAALGLSGRPLHVRRR